MRGSPGRAGGTTSGIVLAGGRSSRFGGDKLAADLDGAAVVARTVEAVRGIVGEVLVIGGRIRVPGVRSVPDERPLDGPLVALATGLRVATGELVVVVGGDMPLVRIDVLRLLLDGVATGAGAAVVLAGGPGQRQPLPMAVRRDAALAETTLLVDGGRRSLVGLLDRLSVVEVPEVAWRALDPEGDTILDVDSPVDLERARARLRSRSAAS